MNKDKSWQEFEELVAVIEKQLAPKGAIVKSPDRIIDKITGRKREVDASIRFQIGSVPILITIECRKRKKVQDDTWLEQLATKKEKIGAQQTIAVSSTSFTQSAIETAKNYGIELRRISDINDTTITGWVEKIIIEKLKIYDQVINWSLEIESDFPEVTFIPEISKAIDEKGDNASIIFRTEDNAGVSINGLIENIYLWQSEGKLGQDSYVGLAGTHQSVTRRITVNFSSNQFYTYTMHGKAEVLGVTIDINTEIKREPVHLSKVYQYSDMNKEITQVAVGKFTTSSSSNKKIYVQPSPSKDEKISKE